MKKLLTRQEVAELLRVHPRTIERWLVSSELKGYKLGKGRTSLWRISQEELDKFLKQNKKRNESN